LLFNGHQGIAGLRFPFDFAQGFGARNDRRLFGQPQEYLGSAEKLNLRKQLQLCLSRLFATSVYPFRKFCVLSTL
jgi:hypothetical protein